MIWGQLCDFHFNYNINETDQFRFRPFLFSDLNKILNFKLENPKSEGVHDTNI